MERVVARADGQNILLTKPSAGCMPIVKIADFGLAKMGKLLLGPNGC
jgi:serine/threonine protein kinase